MGEETEADKVVTISRAHYLNLLEIEREYYALQAFGVNNWEGYSDAMNSLEEGDD